MFLGALGLVRTGATGASAPAEIRWRVRRTRPLDSVEYAIYGKDPNLKGFEAQFPLCL